MKIRIAIIAAVIAASSSGASAATIEETGMTQPTCVVDRIPNFGRWEYRAICTFGTEDANGTVIRSQVRFDLASMEADNWSTVGSCLDLIWGEMYASEGFEVPEDPGLPPVPEFDEGGVVIPDVVE